MEASGANTGRPVEIQSADALGSTDEEVTAAADRSHSLSQEADHTLMADCTAAVVRPDLRLYRTTDRIAILGSSEPQRWRWHSFLRGR